LPKSPEQKIMELEAQVKLLEKQKALLEIENYNIELMNIKSYYIKTR
jgi:hypothetical protein